MKRMSGRIICLITALMPGFLSAADEAFPPEQIEFFEKKIRPIFVEHCQKCHSVEKQEGSLRLDSRAAVLQGGDTGPAVVPGQLDAGELIQAILYDPDGYQMPPEGKLPQGQIELLREWVLMGAPWGGTSGPAGAAVEREFDLDARARHWSFQPLRPTDVPPVKNVEWCRSPIDRFILSKLEEHELAPAMEADRRTWIRRAYLDVIGLLPSPDEVRSFLDDETPQAHERVIDRLLDSAHYGERWGRHWLDVVRYAESRGHEFDYDVANAWQYRDYVIRALNADVPYDRFVIEHVAGDLLISQDGDESEQKESPRPTPSARHSHVGNESILGTGFWFLGEWVHSPVDIRQEEADRFDNMIDVYSKAFLGLTVACARCHDHKFDPITQKDFYALQGYLRSSSYQQAQFETMDHNGRIARSLEQLERTTGDRLHDAILKQSGPVLQRLNDYVEGACSIVPKAGTDTDMEALGALADEMAQQKNLDRDRLLHWISHLMAARTDPSDPFHAGAPIESNPTEEESDLTALSGSLETLFRASDLIPAGVGFQLVPHNSTPLDPAVDEGRFSVPPETSLFRFDPIWFTLETHPESGQEPGALSSWQRGGRILRTPTFEIQGGRIFALVKGHVNTYLAVDSHILLNGPLHGALARKHEPAEEWQWVEHRVNGYTGHRAHLEFIPQPDVEFVVAAVVQTDDPKVLAPFRERLFARPRPAVVVNGSVNVAAWQKPGDDASMLNWMLDHPRLFGLDALEFIRTQDHLQSESRRQRETLISQLRKSSHTAPCMVQGSPEAEYVFIRGNWKKAGATVPPRYLEVFGGHGDSGIEDAEPRLATADRLDLAMRMTDPGRTPILPRVIANRIWKHYFGRGIVPTPNDFGHLGQPPTHAELLDWLANELVQRQWSLKALHREILLSSAYRMSSDHPSRVESSESGNESGGSRLQRSSVPRSSAVTDPDNQLFHRMNVKRLEGEIIRDCLLCVSGRLDRTTHGPSVPIHLTTFLEGRGRPGKSGPVDGEGRRSIYLSVRRNFPEPFFQAFDFPNPHTSIGQRNVSNVPAQALAMLNNPLVVQQARVWAERTLRDLPAAGIEDRVHELFETAFSRPPSDHELEAAREFFAAQTDDDRPEPHDARLWADYCHVLLNLKEFLFVR